MNKDMKDPPFIHKESLMNTVILNGLSIQMRKTMNRITENLFKKVSTHSPDIQLFHLDEKKIAPCLGCFSCWIKTPGHCIIDDQQEEILRALAVADRIILLTPLVFGGYGPELKKVLDRIIPVLLPFFYKVRGEIHHPQRYPRTRSLGAIGFIERKNPEEIELFRDIVERNAINWAARSTAIMILEGDETDEYLMAESDKFLETLEGKS